jgi:poly-gamma-glutamate capsule biosynthesis protein CapA/YwtB (metallophosphatase superfamily)
VVILKEVLMKKIKSQRGLRGVRRFVTGLVFIALEVTSVSLVQGQGPVIDDTVVPRQQFDAAKELAMKITEPFTFAAVGDIIDRHPMGQLDDPGFQALIKVMRSADMTYANMERPIIDDRDPNYHGAHGETSKAVIDDLKAMGIRVVTTANNHIFDGGNEGIFTTGRLLAEGGIIYAGTGKDLTEARKAQYGITPKGAIGVVGMWSIDPGSSGRTRDSDARENWPGLNPLHVTPYNIVTAEQMAALRKIRDASYAHRSEVIAPVASKPPNEGPNDLFLFGIWFKVGEKTGAVSYRMDQSDLAGIIRSIRYGKQNSDFMIAAIHCHQNSFTYQSYSHDNSTPDFLIDLAHEAIDNGADVFVGHGVHTLRGVEIYKGKPIFYGLSNFLFQDDPDESVTDPSYRPPTGPVFSWAMRPSITTRATLWGPGDLASPDAKEVLLTTSRYEGGKLVEVRLYPVDLGIDGTRTESKEGVPMTPSPENAQRILKLVQDISKPFGTTISIEDNVGVIRVPQSGNK